MEGKKKIAHIIAWINTLSLGNIIQWFWMQSIRIIYIYIVIFFILSQHFICSKLTDSCGRKYFWNFVLEKCVLKEKGLCLIHVKDLFVLEGWVWIFTCLRKSFCYVLIVEYPRSGISKMYITQKRDPHSKIFLSCCSLSWWHRICIITSFPTACSCKGCWVCWTSLILNCAPLFIPALSRALIYWSPFQTWVNLVVIEGQVNNKGI